MKNTLFFISLLFFSAGCRTTTIKDKVVNTLQKDKIVIAFGSCSHQDREQNLWGDILAEKPDIWIWLGDNFYGDTQDLAILQQKYNKQKSHPVYQQLRNNTTILGTWDDHDYGANDAGKEYEMKDQSQQALLDFLDVPNDDPRRKRQGVYGSYVLNTSLAKIKVVLLDTRYFRDQLIKEGKANVANWEGTILGDAQWKWLEQELQNSEADVHIIASSIQVIPAEHRFEKWENFPKERERLFNLLVDKQVKHPIIISGDRHIGEMSKLEWKGQAIYDITSSSLTHGWSNRRKEANQYRVGPLVYTENYGLIELSRGEEVKIVTTIKSAIDVVEARIDL